jgi:hypothetical protein
MVFIPINRLELSFIEEILCIKFSPESIVDKTVKQIYKAFGKCISILESLNCTQFFNFENASAF